MLKHKLMEVTELLIIILVAAGSANPALKDVFHWKQLDFHYPDEAARKQALTSGEFVAKNNLPLGVEVWKNKLFVTVPRLKSGVPATLNYIDLNDAEKTMSPPLKPYPPDWAAHKIHEKDNETKIVSTFRVRADECDRLWIMDTGLADILGKAETISPPKILIYDLKTDKLIHQFLFGPSHVEFNSFFANIVVDVAPGKCEHTFAYIADVDNYAVVVYSLESDKAYRVKHNFFYPDPLSGNFMFGGVNIRWADGIISLALTPHDKNDGYRTIYFHSLSSTLEFTVNSRVLQNETIANDDYHSYKVLGSRGPNSQAIGSFLDPKTGVLLYTQINKDGIACWNSFTHPNDYSPETNHLVASNNETMISPYDLKVDKESNLWFLTNRLPTFVFNNLNHEDINFRIFKGHIPDLVKDTVCEAWADSGANLPTR